MSLLQFEVYRVGLRAQDDEKITVAKKIQTKPQQKPTQNHRMLQGWTLNIISFHPLLQARTFSTRPGWSRPHPTLC